MPCREIEGTSPIPGDKWATREFHIKWRRWSFIHTSWDTLATLSQLAGYKRVTNYIKRADEVEVHKYDTRDQPQKHCEAGLSSPSYEVVWRSCLRTCGNGKQTSRQRNLHDHSNGEH